MRDLLRRLAAAFVVPLFAASCAQSVPEPTILRVSAIPDQAPENVRKQHQAVIEIVCKAAQVRCEWVDIDSYEGVVEALGAGSINMAYLGGATFVRARKRYGAIPVAIRDVDTRFSSALVVRADSPAQRLENLRGQSFSFGNQSSTSGHVMARYYLRRAGVDPERFFSEVDYSANHDETIARVANGEVAAGIVNAQVAYAAMRASGPLAGRLRVLWETPSYVDYVWVVRRELPPKLRERLLESFLDVDRDDARQAAALLNEGAGGFLPARDTDYERMTEALAQIGMK